MSRLSAAQRRNIPRSQFGVPSKAPGPGSYPMPDSVHAAAAKRFAARFAPPAQKAQIDQLANRKLGKERHKGPHQLPKRKARHMGGLLRGSQGDTLRPGARFDSAGDRIIGGRDVKGETFSRKRA